MVLTGEEMADPEMSEMLEKASTKEDYEKVMNEAKKRALFYVKAMKSAKAELEVFKKAEKKLLTEQRKKEAQEAKKQEAKTERESFITLNIRIDGEKMVTVQVAKNYTVKMLKDVIVLNHLNDIPKKTTRKSRVTFNDTIISDTSRKTLGTLGLEDGSVLSYDFQGAGGGKRSKPSSSEKEVLVFIKPETKATDPPEVQKALALTSVNLTAWLASLDVATLKEMTTRLDDAPRTGNSIAYLSPLMEFIDEFKALTVPNLEF